MFREYDNIKTNMTDEELVLIPTKDLNKVVKESGEFIEITFDMSPPWHIPSK